MTPLDAPEPGFRDMALLDVPAPSAPDRGPGQAPVREAAGRRRLQARFLRAGREAVDDRELLELLLSGHRRTTLLDHVVVTPAGSVSFQARGLL